MSVLERDVCIPGVSINFNCAQLHNNIITIIVFVIVIIIIIIIINPQLLIIIIHGQVAIMRGCYCVMASLTCYLLISRMTGLMADVWT